MTETTPNNLPLKKTHPYVTSYRSAVGLYFFKLNFE